MAEIDNFGKNAMNNIKVNDTSLWLEYVGSRASKGALAHSCCL